MLRYFVTMIYPKFSKGTHEKYSKYECEVTLIKFTNVDFFVRKNKNVWAVFGVLPGILKIREKTFLKKKNFGKFFF